MRTRIPLSVLLVSALAFLVSLYLPWYVSPRVCNPSGTDCFGASSADGWSTGIGDAAVLLGLALAGAAAAAIRRPRLVDRLPLGAGGLLTAYAAIAFFVLLRLRPAFFSQFDHHVHFHWSYGAYVGLASGAGAGISAAALRRRELVPEGATRALPSLVGIALLVSFLLPWHRFETTRASISELGILSPSLVLAALMVALGGPRRREQPFLLAGAAVFTLGALQLGEPTGTRAYGYWLAFGLAIVLLGVALAAGRDALRVSTLQLPDIVLVGAGALFVASLFLRWQSLCTPHGKFSGTGDACLVANGWNVPGSTAAVLACLVVVATLLGRSSPAQTPPFAVGMGLFVATAGLAVAYPDSVLATHRDYGAYMGFLATAVFLPLALSRQRPPPLDRRRLLVRLPPIAASLACLAAILIAWWYVLPASWQQEAGALGGWLNAAGVLVSLYILWAWLGRVRTASTLGSRLVVAPLALLALLVLVLVEARDVGPTWGQWILLVLSVLLALLGWIEVRGGLEKMRFSEIFRVDRIPETEA
jgi:hypothetical protein